MISRKCEDGYEPCTHAKPKRLLSYFPENCPLSGVEGTAVPGEDMLRGFKKFEEPRADLLGRVALHVEREHFLDAVPKLVLYGTSNCSAGAGRAADLPRTFI